MAGYQRFEAIGNLGKDPELQVTSEGTPLCRFSLAINEPGSKGKDKEPMWLNVTIWHELAEVAEKYLHKGSLVFLAGKLAMRKYTDKQGIERLAVDFIASELRMLDGKPQTASSAAGLGDYDPFSTEL